MMKQFEARLVDAVKRKREADGLSLRGLSALIGVSFSTLARIERGDGLPDNNSKIRLLQWLGPVADEEGLSFENVALVHFRAGKNVRSETVRALLRAADCLKRNAAFPEAGQPPADAGEHSAVSPSKEEMEQAAERFRKDLNLQADQPLDPLLLEIEGVEIVRLRESHCLEADTVRELSTKACDEWSAMSVPLDADHEHWAVLLNDRHSIERQRVTLLEEVWHILLGHKLTKIAKIAEAYGRTYDSAEEHDAYYLASATLLPRKAVMNMVSRRQSSQEIAQQFGTSPELVDYRIKRLGLWRDHVGKRVALISN
jgi:Zn-dependent peptidase ImmA (M78 family)/DNA-binding XRE family transcriptional regulator